MENMLRDAAVLENKVKEAQTKARESPFAAVTVLHRHHFSSTLQRMSVVCKCQPQQSISSHALTHNHNDDNDQWYCLVKGSPEAVRSLLVGQEGSASFPSWYSGTSHPPIPSYHTYTSAL